MALVLALALAACAVTGRPARALSRSGGAISTSASAVSAAPSPAPGVIASRLTPDQLAGQQIIYSYAGLTPPASLLSAIRSGEAAGVIFFSQNISSVAQIRRVIQTLQRARLAGPIQAPLLMMTDQEGGEVRRLPGPPALSEKQIGAGRDGLRLARAAGHAAGETLRAAGMNLNLAPVLDVFRSPGNFIDQYGRSYSSDPATVARLGAAFISAQQATGVAATAKHFPGLGAATRSQNTDEGPVTLGLSAARLRAVDERPYRSAITAGVKVVMVSWARYPALSTLPAGLSSTVIDGELRHRLGFGGVTITDGIEAGAVLPDGSLGARSVRASRAGADLILCAATDPTANDPAIGLTALHAIAHAVTGGQISVNAARATAARVLALRQGLS